MADHLYFGAISEQDINILRCHLGVDEAAKAQAMVGAHHRQSNAGIARAGFYDQGVGIDLPSLQCPLNDGDTGPVLGATAWIEALQLRETVEM